MSCMRKRPTAFPFSMTGNIITNFLGSRCMILRASQASFLFDRESGWLSYFAHRFFKHIGSLVLPRAAQVAVGKRCPEIFLLVGDEDGALLFMESSTRIYRSGRSDGPAQRGLLTFEHQIVDGDRYFFADRPEGWLSA